MTTNTNNEASSSTDSQLQALLNAALAGDGAGGKTADKAEGRGGSKGDGPLTVSGTPAEAAKQPDGAGYKPTAQGAKGPGTAPKADGSDENGKEAEGNGKATDGKGKAADGKGKAADKDKKAADDDKNPLKSFTQLIRERATETDTRPTATLTLRKIIGGDILNTEVVRRQIGVFLLATLFVILYITNRYVCQRDLVQIDKLTKELKDAKYRALSSNSELTEKSRESRVLEMLRTCRDSTLHIASQPPYIVTVPTDDAK